MTDDAITALGNAFGSWVDETMRRVAVEIMKSDDPDDVDPVLIAELHAAVMRMSEAEAKFALVAALMVGGARSAQIADLQHEQVARELHHFETEQLNAELRAQIANHVCS